MSDAGDDIGATTPGWLDRELARLRPLEGEPLLAGIEGIADRYAQLGDLDERAQWLQTLMQVASKQHRFDYELRAFGAMRALYDSSERFADLRAQLLWYYKWLVERLPEFAEIPADRIEAVFGEMESFYRAAGECLRPVYSLRCQAALYMGRAEEATRWFERWHAEPAGKSDDCAACEADRRIVCHLDREDVDAAFDAAADILEGKVGCDETPATLTRLMLPALTSGRSELGFALRAHAERFIRKTPNMVAHLATHVAFGALTGDLSRATRLGRIALARIATTPNDFAQVAVYRGCALWLSAMALAGTRSIALPRSIFPPGTSVADAAAGCLDAARAAAGRLDARNGNSRFADRVSAVEAMIRRMATGGEEASNA